jgi:hypothetical protein
MASTVGAGSGAMRCCAVPARRVSGVSANDGAGQPLRLDAQHVAARQAHRLAVQQDGVAPGHRLDIRSLPKALHAGLRLSRSPAIAIRRIP